MLKVSHIYRIDIDGTENIAFPDGTKVIVDPNGGNIDHIYLLYILTFPILSKNLTFVLDRTLLLPSGQKEIHTATYKVFRITDQQL